MNAFLYFLKELVAVFGRIFGQVLFTRRELDNKNRQLRVQFLIDAWRSVERAANRARSEDMRGLDQALTDIQLFGTASQATQAAKVALSVNARATHQPALDELLELLRFDLRQEMRLGPAPTPLVYLRDDSSFDFVGASQGQRA